MRLTNNVTAGDLKVGQRWVMGTGRPHLKKKVWKIVRLSEDRVYLSREQGGKVLLMNRSFGSLLAYWMLVVEGGEHGNDIRDT